MTVATKLPPMRETDYQSRHIDLDIPALGPDVKTWYAGKNVPPLFIQPVDFAQLYRQQHMAPQQPDQA